MRSAGFHPEVMIMENFVLIPSNGREAVIRKGQLIRMSLSGSIFPKYFQSISLGVLGSFLKTFFVISILMFTEAPVGLTPDWRFVGRILSCLQFKEVLFGLKVRFYWKPSVQICYCCSSGLVPVSTLDTLKAEVQNYLDKRFLLAIGVLPAATSILSYFILVIY